MPDPITVVVAGAGDAEPLFRIDYTITYRGPDDDDFREIGFGSTGGWATVDAAAYEMESNIQRREWETSGDMPDPSAVREMEAGHA
jgi:hypothetical protein